MTTAQQLADRLSAAATDADGGFVVLTLTAAETADLAELVRTGSRLVETVAPALAQLAPLLPKLAPLIDNLGSGSGSLLGAFIAARKS